MRDQLQRAHGRRKLLLGGLALGCALFAKVTPAQADAAGPSAEVLVIHATSCDKPSVDPAIGEAPPLKYNCYKLLDKKTLGLKQGTPGTMSLPNGRTFQVAFNGMDKARFKITTSISKPDGAGFMPLAEIAAEPNKKFHVGGFAYQGGALLLAIRIVP
jgi:hypothetical protein